MADEATQKALRATARRRTLFILGSGAMLGLLLRAIFGFDPAKSVWILLEPWLSASHALEVWMRSEWSQFNLQGWLAAPLLTMLILHSAGRMEMSRKALRTLIPDPPWFAATDLKREQRRTMTNLELDPLPLIGRTDLLDQLDKACAGTRGAFAWKMIVGPTGIGKTRLGLEWLERKRAAGWDIGVVKPVNPSALAGWRARRRTALLIDDARRSWDHSLGELLSRLEAGGRSDRPVRVIVVDQSPLAIELGLSQERHHLLATHLDRPLKIPALAPDEVAELQRVSGFESGDGRLARAAGRPRAALIMLRSPRAESYASALAAWAREMLPTLMEDQLPLSASVGGPLLLASLVGPIPTAEARAECGDIDPIPLLRFYESSSSGRLDEILPLLEPDDLALSLVLQLLPRLDEDRREKLFQRALSWNVALVEDRLAILSEWQGLAWAGIEPDREQVIWLQWMQDRFDAAAPQRVEAIRHEAARWLEQGTRSVAVAADSHWLEALHELAQRRPFDGDIRTAQCKGLAFAMRTAGEAGDFQSLERLGQEVLWLIGLRKKLASTELDRALIDALMAAVDTYGFAGRFNDSERWTAEIEKLVSSLSAEGVPGVRDLLATSYANILHLCALNRHFERAELWGARIESLAAEAPADIAVARARAAACTHAICTYGQVGRMREMRRWLDSVSALGSEETFEPEADVRVYEAEALSDSMGHFGDNGLIADLEACGERLSRLTEDPRFAEDIRFRLREGEGASIAMKVYAERGEFAWVEEWGNQLNCLAEDPRFSGDEDIRFRQIHGASSAIWGYGTNKVYDEMWQWINVAFNVFRNKRFSNNEKIAKGVMVIIVNATSFLGNARRFDQLEECGDELKRISENAVFFENYKIQESLAQAAGNAINCYASAGAEISAILPWLRFIAHHAQHYPAHPGVQAVAGVFNLNAVEQLLDRFPHGSVEPRSQMSKPPPRRMSATRRHPDFG